MGTVALLVIDVQQSFEHMPFWSEENLAAYQSNQNRLIAHAREQSWPVVHIYHQSRGPFAHASGYLTPMNWVDRRPEDLVFYKRVHNALGDSGLESALHARGISRLVISGIRTEQCCETTTRYAKDKGFEVEFIMDATMTFDMQLSDGSPVSVELIQQHTKLVLDRRFAKVWSVAEFIASDCVASINQHCPRSGRRVSSNSLTEYRGFTVGFCNPGCSGSFAADPQEHALDRLYFDKLIATQTAADVYG